jgi:hypothetical protein
MSFFGNLLKGVAFVGGILAAPFTAGASLIATAAVAGSTILNRGGSSNTNLKELLLRAKNNSPTGQDVIERISLASKPIDPPPINYKGEIPNYTEREIIPIEKTDITLYGNYSDINFVTIPVDIDLDNVKVVPNTFFPYIVTFTNHPPSNGVRYISDFIYNKLFTDWNTNLGKVCYNLEPKLSVYPYINFDWKTFVDKYNNIEADKLKNDGGVLYGFTINPEFLLRWMDGPEATNMLDYSWVIPPQVKTIQNPNPNTSAEFGERVSGDVSTDPKREDRLTRLLGIASQASLAYGVAKAALGGVYSIYGNSKTAIKNLQDTAAKVGEKFGQLKNALSKDAINGKITQVKNLIKTKLPTPKNIKSFFVDVKGQFLARINPFKKKLKEFLKRQPKDKSKKIKFSLKNFNLPDLPEAPNLPNIPKLPKQLNLGSINQLPGLGGLPNVMGLVGSAKGVISGIGNMNFKDPLTLLNAPANILNQVSSFGNTTADVVGNTASKILQPTLDAKNAREAQQRALEASLAQIREEQLKSLATVKMTLPKPAPAPQRGPGTIVDGVFIPLFEVNNKNTTPDVKTDSYSKGS